jgi:threonine dehydrogenase-like Zn-dependent dehydrogenase
MACSSVRAAVLVKPKTLEAREFARPATGPDDALLRIEACGICGSDYEQYEAPRSLNDAIAIAVRKGRILIAGLKGLRPTHDVQVDEVIYKELTIRGVLSMPGRRDLSRDRAHRVGPPATSPA